MPVLMYRWHWGGTCGPVSPSRTALLPLPATQSVVLFITFLSQLYWKVLSHQNIAVEQLPPPGESCSAVPMSVSRFQIVRRNGNLTQKIFFLFSEKCFVFSEIRPITMDVVNTLPSELLYKILSYLDRESLFISSQVCLRYKVLTMSDILC